MSTVSRRETLLALSFLPIAMQGCDAARSPVGGDQLTNPQKISARSLRHSVKEQRLATFYERLNWRPAWSASTAGDLIGSFPLAHAHGLDPLRFSAQISSENPVDRELQLTRAALAFGDALGHGVVQPQTLFPTFSLQRSGIEVDTTLIEALSRKSVSAWAQSLAPNDPEYRLLSEAYLKYAARARDPRPAPFPPGPVLKPGMRDPRTPQLGQLLTRLGYLPRDEQTQPSGYDATIVAAVKELQTDNGINADGVVGADTVTVLNAGPGDRALQLALNLEARRWLSRELPSTRIDVNTAATILSYLKDGAVADRRRVVAGKPGHETPNLSGSFRQIIVNPPWNVPDAIAEEEILPKGPAYLAANDMVMEEGRVVQKPGPRCSLGLVKFDMQNPQAIYLHDTPAKGRFSDNERHFSHGCVRVDDAIGFGRRLAAEHGVAEDFNQKLSSGESAAVDLGAEVAVRLLYHTVYVDPQGRLGFRPDVYGWDAVVAEAAGMEAPVRRMAGPATGTVLGP